MTDDFPLPLWPHTAIWLRPFSKFSLARPLLIIVGSSRSGVASVDPNTHRAPFTPRATRFPAVQAVEPVAIIKIPRICIGSAGKPISSAWERRVIPLS
jgi:hypothetical protein